MLPKRHSSKKQKQRRRRMKNNKLKIFLDSKYFTMLLSVIMAIIIWIVVVTFFSTDARATIKDVPIDVDYNSAYLNLDLEIIEQSVQTLLSPLFHFQSCRQV